MAKSIWKILGIEQTSEQRDIRRAYAEKLKAIDVDGEPDKFIALREAYDHAISYARYAQYDDDEDFLSGEDDVIISDRSEPVEIETTIEDKPFASSTQPNPWAEPSGEVIYDEIIDILTDENEGSKPLSEEHSARVEYLTGRFLAWLNNAAIDQARDYEFAIAHLMTVSIPRSDPMLERVSGYFNWDATAENWDSTPQIRAVLDRRDSNRVYTAILEPSHPLHSGYQSLTADEPVSRRQKHSSPQIRELLELAYWHYPSLSTVFNPERVGEWERRLKITYGSQTTASPVEPKQDLRKYWLAFFLIVALVRACASFGDETDSPLSVGQGYNQQSTLNLEQAVSKIFGKYVSASNLEEKNPDLFKLILTNKRIAAEAGNSQIVFENNMEKLVLDRYALIAQNAEPIVLRSYWRLFSEKAAYLKSINIKSCTEFLRSPNEIIYFPDIIKNHQQDNLQYALLIPVIVQPKKLASNSVPIPDDVVEKVRKQSGLSASRITQAMQSKGSETDRCIMTIALTKSLSDTNSAEATKTMRALIGVNF